MFGVIDMNGENNFELCRVGRRIWYTSSVATRGKTNESLTINVYYSKNIDIDECSLMCIVER